MMTTMSQNQVGLRKLRVTPVEGTLKLDLPKVDDNDFRVYRRNEREIIPTLSPAGMHKSAPYKISSVHNGFARKLVSAGATS
jgi:hypothetical protein